MCQAIAKSPLPFSLMHHVQFYLNNKKLEQTKILTDRGFIKLLFDLIK